MNGKTGYMLRIALIGMALAISGCAMPNDPLLSDSFGLQTAYGNARHGEDGLPDHSGRGNGPAHTDGGQGSQNAGDIGAAGGPVTDAGGPGNSDFGRGTHANAGGGNGSETTNGQDASDQNPDMDPGASGSSKGRSALND